MRNWKLIVTVVCCLYFALACGGGAAPTSAPVPPTPVPGTATATAAGATLPAAPTVAPNATGIAPETATPGDPNAITLLTKADFGNDRNPLTGELVDDPAVLQRRPLAIKISNAPPVYVRPQSGLNEADLVYEHTSEGSITRLTAIFYGKSPPRVGPIRSARLIDLELPAMYDAGLAFSGASAGVNQRLNSSDFQSRIIYSSEPGYFRSGEDKPLEHTLYGNPADFWQALAAKGQNTPPAFNTFMAFSNNPPPGGQPASAVTLNYQWEIVEWRYDPAIGRYRRWAGGEPHLDGNTGEQVTAANVIILTPTHVEDATICEEIRDGACAHLSIQIQLWGTGTGIVLRDGQQYPVTWHRVNRNDMLTFTYSEGNSLPLQLGNSWVQLVPNWLEGPVQISP